MESELYIITAHTNLHVGSGDSNYGIIDKLVQRDVLTGFPSIHESSLKGAIKSFFVHQVQQETGQADAKRAAEDPRIEKIFGNPNSQGNYRFFGGHLLLFPVRTDRTPYLLATCPKILSEFIEMAGLMGAKLSEVAALESLAAKAVMDNQPLVFDSSLKGLPIEYHDLKSYFKGTASIPKILGDKKELVLMSDHDFGLVCGENKLPVLARNNLEDGRSTNLWYEEIVPRQSKFYCFIADASPSGIDSDTAKYFAEKIEMPMQMGANASIGYGLVKFEKLPKL